MLYTLISKEYVPAVSGTKLVQGIKGGGIPRGTIRGGNGSFIVKGEGIPAEFNVCFRDAAGNEYSFDAYSTIKANMINERLTEKRCYRVSDEVEEIAATSSTYDPVAWFETATRKLKI